MNCYLQARAIINNRQLSANLTVVVIYLFSSYTFTNFTSPKERFSTIQQSIVLATYGCVTRQFPIRWFGKDTSCNYTLAGKDPIRRQREIKYYRFPQLKCVFVCRKVIEVTDTLQTECICVDCWGLYLYLWSAALRSYIMWPQIHSIDVNQYYTAI